jgi:thimet oligopeptidase
VLVTNFNRVTNEMETLVHNSATYCGRFPTRYLAHAGTSGDDFVEAPCRCTRNGHASGIDRLLRNSARNVRSPKWWHASDAHNFGRGIRYARQHLYASYDMTLYNASRRAARHLANGRRDASRNVPAPPSGQFEHIIRNYGAGQYGYMWSSAGSTCSPNMATT